MKAPYDPATIDALRPRAREALRGHYRALRAALPREAGAVRSASIASKVIGLDVWQAARTVAVYSALREEVSTEALIADARARGITVALPVVVGDGALEFRVAYSAAGDHPLVAGVWGILQPSASAPVVDLATLDVVVVPALAVDPRGFRLGYGKGHYDQTLPRATRAVRVAVLFEFQLIAEVPEQGHDVPVDWIVTDRRVLRATDGRMEPPSRVDTEKP